MKNRTCPALLGDIGATHARWAWRDAPDGDLQHSTTYACDRFESVHAVIEQFLLDHRLPRPAGVAFGIATPVTGDLVRMTNRPWEFSIAGLQAALGVERCVVLNDFAALALALPALTPADVRRVGGGAAVSGEALAVIGPGSGLGAAGLLALAGGHHLSIAGEGGHVSLAAANPREDAVIAKLRQRFGHASAERALSGPGLVNLYDAVCALDSIRPEPLRPADVTARALAGSDVACTEALELFGALLGSVAGNLALTLGARGGVFVGGGIVPGLGAAFDALPFRRRFEDKGRYRGYLERIPTAVITAPGAALVGAAMALESSTQGSLPLRSG